MTLVPTNQGFATSSGFEQHRLPWAFTASSIETIEIIREVFAGFKKAGDALLDRKRFE